MTEKENQADREKHGTSNRGNKHQSAVLTALNIPAIRNYYSTGMTMQEIADMFGVGRTKIAYIIRGKTWAHVQQAGLYDSSHCEAAGLPLPPERGELTPLLTP